MELTTLTWQFFLGVFAILLPFALLLLCVELYDRARNKLQQQVLEDIDFDPMDEQIEAENKANPLSKNFTHDCID